jgi:hypothetical protein
MAGAGAKLFVDGEALDAAEVNTYLMDQSIMRFATTAARDAAFGGVGEPALAEGMTCYIDADNSIYTYDGGSWVKMVSTSQPNGLWLISSGTNSGATGYNHDSVFTSEFRNYRVVLTNVEVSTAGRAIRLNYRSAGSTNNTSNYNYAYRGLRETGVTADTSSGGAVGFAEVGIYIDNFPDTPLAGASFDIYSPQLAARTGATSIAYAYEGLAFQYRQGGFLFNQANTFDGFRLFLSGSGNFKYEFAIYGYGD